MGAPSLFIEKTKVLLTELHERAEPAISSYYVASHFLQYILCLWIRIIRSTYQGVKFMNFSSEIYISKDFNDGYRTVVLKKNSLWLPLFFMNVATSGYCEKVRGTMHSAIVLYLRNYIVLMYYY